MSGICGILMRDDRSVTPEHLVAMMAAIRHRAVDGSATRTFGVAGFGAQRFSVSPESTFSTQPFLDEPSGLAVVADCRIHNRDELSAWLGAGAEGMATMPDEVLLLNAFKKAGEPGLERVEGEFAAAIFSTHRRELTLVTDAMGTRRIFYREEPGRFLFASEAKGILAAPDVPLRLNERKVALCSIPLAQQLDRESTFFDGILRLPGAMVMRVDAHSVTRRRYWSVGSESRAYRSDEECVQAVREAVVVAVRSRTRSRHATAVLLSGGLDSSVLAVVAREVAENEGRRLTAISSVSAPPFREGNPDEREFIEMFRGLPNLDLELFEDPRPGPFDELPEIIRLNESPLGTSRQYLYRGLGGIARAKGARILLDGAFGELGPSFNGRGGLAELVRTGHVGLAAWEIRQRRKRRPQGLWTLLKGEVLRPLLPASWLRRVGRGGGLPAGMEASRFTAFFHKDYLLDVLKDQVEALNEEARALVELAPDHRLNQQRSIEFARSSSGGLFPPSGVSLERPFLDRRLLEACLAAPLRLKCGPAGDRLLIRHAFAEKLPDRIRWRTSKSPFAPDYAARYNRDRRKALDHIDGAEPFVGGRLDLDKLRAALQVEMVDSRGRNASDFAAIYSIPIAVRLALFLKTFRSTWVGGSV